ncbi:MAG: hypothetical protein DBX59_08560 [Bacillota bacterium]|nr:MAG: hypothetical protein DBX59_08560 [Bacillota bacterium]
MYMEGRYKIADVVFDMKTKYAYTHKLCAGYESEEKADFLIETDDEAIKREEEASDQPFPPAYLESLAVYRRLCNKILSDYNGFLFHASAVAVDGYAYLFTAPSGTGKSTHTRLWRELLGERAVMINDDKPVVRYIDGAFYVYGTPWNGKHRLSRNDRARLAAVCELTRGEKNEIARISSSEMVRVLMNQSLRGEDGESMLKLLDLFDKLAKNTAFYRLKCNISREAAETAYGAMRVKGEDHEG